MADIPEGSFTHTLEEIDTATTQVEDAKGNAASLAAAITAAAETAASTAIGNLDYSEVGGTGKYISAISEADGKISATATNIASAPASGGTAAISSGAVYTALSGKIGISDVFGLGSSSTIPNGANLNDNDYVIPGVYIRSTSPSNSGITNIPMDGDTYAYSAFKLTVEYVNSENNIRQTLIPLYSSTGFFVRHKMAGASGTWRSWYYYGGTEVIPPASLTSINPAQLQSTPPDDDEMR